MKDWGEQVTTALMGIIMFLFVLRWGFPDIYAGLVNTLFH